MRMCLQGIASLQCVEAFSPTDVCFGGEQNRESYEALKRTISTQVGWGCYRWYQSHALARSVGPTHEDACARKGGGL